jgi:hypothetical protein
MAEEVRKFGHLFLSGFEKQGYPFGDLEKDSETKSDVTAPVGHWI